MPGCVSCRAVRPRVAPLACGSARPAWRLRTCAWPAYAAAGRNRTDPLRHGHSRTRHPAAARTQHRRRLFGYGVVMEPGCAHVARERTIKGT